MIQNIIKRVMKRPYSIVPAYCNSRIPPIDAIQSVRSMEARPLASQPLQCDFKHADLRERTLVPRKSAARSGALHCQFSFHRASPLPLRLRGATAWTSQSVARTEWVASFSEQMLEWTRIGRKATASREIWPSLPKKRYGYNTNRSC